VLCAVTVALFGLKESCAVCSNSGTVWFEGSVELLLL
jgi:hypothetical protein